MMKCIKERLKTQTVNMVVLALALVAMGAQPLKAQPDGHWLIGYYPIYVQDTTSSPGQNGLTPSQLDYSKLTHIIYWGVEPTSTGGLNTTKFVSAATFASGATAVVTNAHAAGTKALIGIGGDAYDGFSTAFTEATTPANLPAFVDAIVNLMQQYNFDGVDINWEQIGASNSADNTQFPAFIKALRAKLNTLTPKPLLTMAPETKPNGGRPDLIGPIAADFDQLNIQTYLMTGNYCGFETWYSSPLSNGGKTLLLDPSEALPSVYSAVADYTSAGVPISELGMGMQLGGVIWQGGSGASLNASGTPSTGGVIEPLEIWAEDSGTVCSNAPGYVSPDAPSQNQGVPYTTILSMSTTPGYSAPVTDQVADQTWIGYNASNGSATNESKDQFISYESPASIAKKGTDLAAAANQITLGGVLGGVMLFELSGDFTPSASGDAQHPLITAASQMASLLPGALTGLTDTPGPAGSNTATLNWNAATGAASYNVYVGSNATGTPTNTVNTTLALSSLTPGGNLEYYVEGIDAFGAGTGASVSFTNSGGDIPTGLKAAGFVGSVSLNWNPVPGATGYDVLRANSARGAYSLPVKVTTNSYLDNTKTLVDGTRFYYVVESIGSWGTSGKSSQVSAVPVAALKVPTGLAATAGPGQVLLTWNAVANAASYEVWYKTESSSSFPYKELGFSPTPTFDYTANFNGTTTYYFAVSAVLGTYVTADSAQVSAKPEIPIPARPGTPVAVAGANQVTVSWLAVSGATGYYVLRSTTSGTGYVKLTTASPITTTSYTDTTAVDGIKYYYVVEAYNSSGASGNSPQASATPSIPAPAGLNATVNTNVVTLSWNAVAGVTGYEVLRGTVSGGPYATEVGTVSAPTTTLNDTTAIPGTPYYYVVEAYYFVAGQNVPATFSPNSNQVEVTVTATKLASPTGLQAFLGQGGLSVNLTWNKEAGVVSYNILRSTTNGGPYSLETTSFYAGYLGDPVSPGTTYYYVVQAVNSAGTSGYSNQATIAIPKATIPATPIFTIGVQNGVIMVEQLDAVYGATSYAFCRSTSATGTYKQLYSGPNLIYNDTTAVPGTTYYYEMTASNSAGTSPISAPQSAIVPLTPTGLKATAGNAQVVVTWTAVAGASGYNVERGTTSGTYDWFVGSPTTNTVTDTTVVNGTTYYYIVQTIGADGFSTGTYSAPVSATPVSSNVSVPTGLTATTVNAAGAVTLNWTASAGSTAAYSYLVYGGNSAGGESTTALTTVTGNATTATLTGLASNKTWYFIVKAMSGATLSNASNEVTAVPRIVYVPSYEAGTVNVRIGGGATLTSISIALPTCNPNSLAVNQNKLYVVCSLSGENPDQILVYNAATIRAAASGSLTISPIQTITSADFDSLIGIAFDSSNNLWVASNGNNDVLEFTSASLATPKPTDIVSLVNSPGSPAGLAFDTDGSLWITGEYDGGIVLNFEPNQFGTGSNANPRYCIANEALGGPCIAPNSSLLESPEGVAVFNGSVWVANNSTTGSNGLGGATPARELVNLAVVAGALTVKGTYGKTLADTNPGTPTSPFVCPGGLFASGVQLWVNDESYGETNPACGADGDVTLSNTGGVFAFTAAELAAEPATQAPVFTSITGRQGFGGVFVENDR
jgi:GH18 family chitinase/fibronectin type 3 domain-containing protein/sugar lactone lactonase YvrE